MSSESRHVCYRIGQSAVAKQYKFDTSASWEGTVDLASHWPCATDNKWYYHLQAHSLRKGDEHPT